MKRAAAVIAVALLLPLTAHADPAGCFMLKQEAQRGNPDREFLYGQAVATGACGFRVNKPEAGAWYRKAADHGNVPAAHALAEMYFSGDGMPLNYVEAKRWYTRAATMGDGPSQLRLAFLNAENHFAPLKTNYAEAERWFRKAADQNIEDAQFRLGNFYLNYKHPADYAQGVPWLRKAAEGGNRTAMFDLGRLLLAGEGVAKDTNAGLTWIKQSANDGTVQAQMMLAGIYADGKTVPVDAMESLKWIMKIVNGPDPSVYYLNRAGDIFFDGWDAVPKNYPAARTYYERAAKCNDPHALERLAQMYRQGLGVPPDEAKAAEFETRIKH